MSNRHADLFPLAILLKWEESPGITVAGGVVDGKAGDKVRQFGMAESGPFTVYLPIYQ